MESLEESIIKDLQNDICGMPLDLGRASLLDGLVQYLREQYRSSKELLYLEIALEAAQESLESSSRDDDHWAGRLGTLGCLLADKYFHTMTVADLDEALSVVHEAVDVTTPADSGHDESLCNLGELFYSAFLHTGYFPTLDKAIRTMRLAIDVIAPDDPAWAKGLLFLGDQLRERYKYTEKITDLDEAIQLSRIAIDATPIDHPNRAAYLERLARHLGFRHTVTHSITDIDEAVFILQHASSLLSPGHPQRCRYLWIQSTYLTDRHWITGKVADLEEAIYLQFDSLCSWEIDDDQWVGKLNDLASSISERFNFSEAMADINATIVLAKAAIDATPRHDTRTMGTILLNLSVYIGHRHSLTGSPADLDEAIRTSQSALEILPDKDESLVDALVNHSGYLGARYKHNPAMSDIDQAIHMAQEAAALMSPDYKKRYILFGNLGSALNDRYRRTHSIADLNESIRCSQEALDLIPSNNPLWLMELNRLGLRIGRSFTGEVRDIMESILILREVVDKSPHDNKQLPGRLLSLAMMLQVKYEHTRDMADLEEAIQMGQRAANAKPITDPHRPGCLTFLGLFLCRRSTLMADRAIAARKALERSDNMSRGGLVLDEVSSYHYGDDVYYYSKAMQDRSAAQAYFIEVVSQKSVSALRRVMAGGLLLLHFEFLRHEKAYDIAKLIANSIPVASLSALQNTDRQFILSMYLGVPSNAAAVALEAVPPERRAFAAIELLETSRGLIGGALFEHQDISALEKHYPDLAQAHTLLKGQLTKSAPRDSYITVYETTANIQAAEAAYSKVEDDLAQTIETIRSKPGFERFLLSNSERDMLDAVACGSPIVVINISHYRCDALIIANSGMQVLELSNVSKGIVDEYSGDLESLETLGWLWDDIVCPVLDVLGYTETPSSDTRWPHICWIPTGILSKFPLHAAGHHSAKNGKAALDRVVSSYATSVKAAIQSRRREAPKDVRNPSLMAVAMGDTDGYTPLYFAEREVDAILDILQSTAVQCNRPATNNKRDVLSSLKTCEIFHFAGHGQAHPTDPLQSTLLLEDWRLEPLSVASLLDTDFSSNPPFLAYLSACGTSQILFDDARDESIHLASACQLAGFRHVIGTLWSVDDELCVTMARLFYGSLCERMEDEAVSLSLHHAVRTLRNEWVSKTDEWIETQRLAADGLREGRYAEVEEDEVELTRPLWIPYVHFGV